MIYLLEDDDNIRKLVEYALSSQGIKAEGFARPSEFWGAVDASLPDLIMLDIMLPEQNGLDILKSLKSNAKTASVPVIMLTAKGTEFDKVTGLDMGADDYIAKPFGMTELIARVKAVLRRYEKAADKKQKYKVGEVEIHPDEHRVLCSGKEVVLSLKEYELLLALVKADGKVLTRDNLLNDIWGYDFDGETRTVDVHIRRLRSKLGDGGNIIETVKGVGYKTGGDIS